MKTRTKLALVAGAMVLTLLLASVGIATAQTHTPTRSSERRGARVYGIVAAVEGDSLALATPTGAVTILVDGNTRFHIPGVEQPGLDDLSVGDCVGADGWWENAESAFHAFGVARLRIDRAFPLGGSLNDIDTDTLVVETAHGLAAVRVDGETVYRVHDVEQAGLDDLDVGMRAIVKGTLGLDGSLLAHTVAVPRPRTVRLQGEVLAVEGDTFTIRTARDRQPGRQLTVQTDETTEFHVPGVDNASIADLQIGDRIAGSGQPGGRTTLVVVLPEQVARLAGEVVAVDDAALELDTPGGTVSALTGVETILRIPGVEEPTVDDIEVGDHATATGVWVDEATFDAIGVNARGGHREGQRCAVRGRVIRVESDQLVLGTLHGPVTVLVGDETQYRVPGVDDPGLDDVTPGAVINVRGMWNEDGALQATSVVVAGGQ